MEEIDSIIIDSLKNLNCDLEDEISSLKQFDPDTVVKAISCCLEAILPGTSFPRSLPPSMTLRLKLATTLAEQIKELGFRGDMGYQSVLYSNETEIRRVLMFLIERLPRDTNKVTMNEEIGYVPKLVKEIEKRVKVALQKPWVPTCVLFHGTRDCGDFFNWQSFGNSRMLVSRYLHIPRTEQNQSKILQHYWVQKLPEVTKQCTQNELIPSLLFKDIQFAKNHQVLMSTSSSIISSAQMQDITENAAHIALSTDVKETLDLEGKTEQDEATLLEEIRVSKQKILDVENEIKLAEQQAQQLQEAQAKQEEIIKDMENKIQIKNKTLTVLSKDENMEKLKNLVEKGNERLIQLAEQWNQVQAPLLEEYRTKQNALHAQDAKVLQDAEKLKKAQETYHQLLAELKEKEQLEQELIQKCKKLNKTTNRSAYTRRILEIIGNIKKQNEEIQKILKDTREVQKEINTLNGQIDRSFTLSDEMIFRDARHDEMARKAYKLLAALHSECGDIIKIATEIGTVQREARNLEDQIEVEMAKGTAAKLERVLADIEQVEKETALLLEKQ